MNKQQALLNLIDVQQEFPLGFLVYGSALGAHRENDIIDHDLDVDFGVFSSYFNIKSINNLVKKGFKITLVLGMRHYGFEISLMRGGVKTDIMLIYHDEERNKYWNSLWDNGGRHGLSDEIRHEYDEEVFDKVEFINIQGHTFNYFGEKYIKAVYGEDWKIPVKKWNWRTDHKCIKK